MSNGTQLWVKSHVVLRVISFVPISPRIVMLVIHVRGRARPVRIFSVHAPHNHQHAAVKDDFWNTLSAKVRQAKSAQHSIRIPRRLERAFGLSK